MLRLHVINILVILSPKAGPRHISSMRDRIFVTSEPAMQGINLCSCEIIYERDNLCSYALESTIHVMDKPIGYENATKLHKPNKKTSF